MTSQSEDPNGEGESTLSGQLEELRDALSTLTKRVEALEGGARLTSEVGAEEPPPSPEIAARERGSGDTRSSLVALLGRGLVVLGGAFFLRMLAENKTLVEPFGFIFGLVYASVWILFAHRAAARQRAADAISYGVIASVIGYPLLWESSTSFGFSTISLAALLLTVFTALLFWVIWRHRLRGLIWIVLVFVVFVDFGLFFQSRELVPVVAQLLVTAGLALWTSYDHEWRGPPWLIATAANLLVAVVGLVVALERPEWLTPGQVLVCQAGLVAVFSLSFLTRHLFLARHVQAFEIAQLVAIFVVGIEGAAQVAQSSGMAHVVGFICLVIAVAGYGIAFWVAARRDGYDSTIVLYSAIGGVALFEGLRLAAPPTVMAVCLLPLAVAAAWFGRRERTSVLRLHTGAFVLVGAVAAGLGTTLSNAFVLQPAEGWRYLGASPALALCLLVISYLVLQRTRPTSGNRGLILIPETVTMFIIIAGVAGAILGALAGPIASSAGDGALTVLRTAVLMVAASLVAIWASFAGYRHLRILAWIFVALGALKVVIVDVPSGGSGTLFLSLVFFGTCLIVVARLGATKRGAPDREDLASTAAREDDEVENLEKQ